MIDRQKLPREFYTRPDTLLIARQLLGKKLVVPAPDGARVAGRIIETEAYLGAADKASHAFGNRRTKRTETMFKAGGIAYVYFIYGLYYQFNVVTGAAEIPDAVLIRALEPIEGVDRMRERRPRAKHDRQLTSGPGKLCIALGIDRSHDGADLLGDRVWIEEEEGGEKIDSRQIISAPRVGISYAAEFAAKPWRFRIRN